MSAKVLIIEPDRLLAELLSRACVRAGWQAAARAHAQAAIAAADEARPDIVVLELQLIEHSGIEFLYEFRSYTDWQNIPVIIHTCVPKSEFAGSADLLKDHLGVKAYLYKPNTSLKQLLNCIEALLPLKTAA